MFRPPSSHPAFPILPLDVVGCSRGCSLRWIALSVPRRSRPGVNWISFSVADGDRCSARGRQAVLPFFRYFFNPLLPLPLSHHPPSPIGRRFVPGRRSSEGEASRGVFVRRDRPTTEENPLTSSFSVHPPPLFLPPPLRPPPCCAAWLVVSRDHLDHADGGVSHANGDGGVVAPARVSARRRRSVDRPLLRDRAETRVTVLLRDVAERTSIARFLAGLSTTV